MRKIRDISDMRDTIVGLVLMVAMYAIFGAGLAYTLALPYSADGLVVTMLAFTCVVLSTWCFVVCTRDELGR